MKRLLPLVILLAGCAELGAIGTGLQTARTVAKTACAILEGTDGSSTAVLAALAKRHQQTAEQQARDAAGTGAPCPVTCTTSPTCVLDAPGQPPAPAGQACSGGVCDGAGKCCAVAP